MAHEPLLRVLGRLKNGMLNKAFSPWRGVVDAHKAQQGEEADKAKRHELVVKRFRAKMQNKGLFMCYAGWQAFLARMKWERATLARCAKKISQRCLVSSIGGWREFVSERKRVRELLLRIFGRLENSFVLKGFNPWLDAVNEGKEGDATARRHEVIVERFSRKLRNKGLFMCYAGWQAFLARMKWERATLARCAKKISQRCLVSSIGGWREFVSERKRVRELLLNQPMLLELGTEAQKQRHLPSIARAETRWCQGYSEPGAGSDLASLQTRAEDHGDYYLINGSKIWTSNAYMSDWMFCLVRQHQL